MTLFFVGLILLAIATGAYWAAVCRSLALDDREFEAYQAELRRKRSADSDSDIVVPDLHLIHHGEDQ